VRRFNWVRSPTAWESSQAWRARQSEMRDSFEAVHSNASSTFFSATMNLATGASTIVAQTAQKRIQAQAVRAALNKLA
jgi:hypothetical protein